MFVILSAQAIATHVRYRQYKLHSYGEQANQEAADPHLETLDFVRMSVSAMMHPRSRLLDVAEIEVSKSVIRYPLFMGTTPYRMNSLFLKDFRGSGYIDDEQRDQGPSSHVSPVLELSFIITPPPLPQVSFLWNL